MINVNINKYIYKNIRTISNDKFIYKKINELIKIRTTGDQKTYGEFFKANIELAKRHGMHENTSS